MKSALRSLAFATLVVLICIGLAWLYLKSKAAGQPLKKPVPTTFFAGDSAPLTIIQATGLDRATLEKTASSAVFWLDTQVTRDRKAIVLTEKELANPNYNAESADRSPESKLKVLGVRYMNWEDVQKAKPTAALLEDVLLAYPNKRFVINVVDYSPEADAVFSEAVSKTKSDDRIIFQSEQDGPLTDLRKLEPMWLYGTSRAQVVQTLWLINLGLEGVAPLRGDVLITTLRAGESNQKSTLLTPELVSEARRRSMKVLVGPVHNSELEEVRNLGVDGVIYSDPTGI